MNKWRCPHCDDELLGSVNRCWKCGQRVTPPAFDQVLVAVEVASAAELATKEAVLTAVSAEPTQITLTADDLALAMTKEPPRRGSPFAFDTTLTDRAPQEPFVGAGPYQRETKGRRPPVLAQNRALTPSYPKNQAAIGGVAASLVLGIASLAILPFTILGCVTATIGVVCGIWGMFHDRKGVASIGLLLCCIALAISLYLAGFALYEVLYPAVMTPPPAIMPP